MASLIGAGQGGSSPAVHISCEFDGGNIEVIDSTDPYGAGLGLRVRKDIYTELEKKAHCQWFYFKAVDSRRAAKFRIVNASKCSFPDAWEGTTVCFSTDREVWHRALDTDYDKEKGELAWSWPPAAAAAHVFFAFFAPFSWERHLSLIQRAALSPHATARVIGATLDGRDLDVVTVGTGPLQAWAIHRQHPGESQAEFYAEGLIDRLLDGDDAIARTVRAAYTFHVVPNVNPDGSIRGHLRTNARGCNLNREWAPTGNYAAPTLERSPEVYHVLRVMDETGVDLFVDVHGDEEIPLNFVSGMEGCPNWGPRLEALQGAFVNAYKRANPDFQTEISYEPDPPGGGNMCIASNQVATRFNCLAVTMEQPFKDNAGAPDPERGWTPQKCARLGASLLEVAAYVAPLLRADGAFYATMPAADAYVRPVEGSARPTVHRAAGYVYQAATAKIQELDKLLGDAERQCAALRLQRANLAPEEDAASDEATA
ncbi:hypothetical protein M885DRAFT_550242 [Pelagophyceae sp. CCMP2097]|nr:hypothetical protein M885DRAFT_550242 [Pelagophyceae sp. CCMP2097]